MAPVVGRLTDRVAPALLTSIGFGLRGLVDARLWPGPAPRRPPLWQLLLPMALLGFGNAFLWAPLGRDRHPQPADDLGRRRRGRLQRHPPGRCGPRHRSHRGPLQARLAADLPGISGQLGGLQGSGATMPAQVASGFADAMAESMMLPAAVLLIGVVAVLFFERPAIHRV